jgi:ADP-ribose pyrophosphatase YjhB (NUDIX family)
MTVGDPTWLDWARRLRAIAQTGQTYTNDSYDRQRFDELALIAAQMLAGLSGAPVGAIVQMYIPERGYPTPKVDVRAGVFRDDGRVLLVREAADGRWALPGGWADEQETPRRACEREVFEESGHEVRAIKLAAVKDRTQHPYTPQRLEHVYKLLFVCEWIRATPHVIGETTDAAFWPRTQLPELSLGRTLADDVELLWQHRVDAALPCYFD